jgi:hypothetical protein
MKIDEFQSRLDGAKTPRETAVILIDMARDTIFFEATDRIEAILLAQMRLVDEITRDGEEKLAIALNDLETTRAQMRLADETIRDRDRDREEKLAIALNGLETIRNDLAMVFNAADDR